MSVNLKVKMQLNPITGIEVDFENDDLQDVIRQAGALLDFDGKCGLCNGPNDDGVHDITIQTRVTKEKGYKFTEFVCRGCGARRSFGKYQDGGGFFLKDWEEKFQPQS